jgi:hypothetical protein
MSSPWLSNKEAAEYVRCASVKAFYEWRKRHGIVTVGRRLVAKADLDRALAVRRPRKPMAAASLRNLTLSPKRAGRAS